MSNVLPIDPVNRIDPDALAQEANVLGVAIVYPKTWPEVALLRPEDFSWFPHVAIYEAMVAVTQESQPLDELTITERMRMMGTFDKLRMIGGVEYFTKLRREAITFDTIAWHVDHVAARAARKRIATAAMPAITALQAGESSAEHFFATLHALESENRVRPPMTPAQRVRRLGEAHQRLTTRIPTLDKGTRGGLPFARVIVLGGAPGAGKTSLASQLAWQWCRRDPKLHATFCAYDQGSSPILVRVGQNERFDRDVLEQGYHPEHADQKELLARCLEATPNWQVLDGTEELVTIEAASRALKKAAKGPGVLIVDSIQKAQSVTVPRGKVEERERLGYIVEALKRAAHEQGHMVIATSELNRGGFRNKEASQNSEDLASFMGSSAIEYGADFALVLRKVKGEGSFVDVGIAKSRIGEVEPFRLQITHSIATLAEVDKPKDDGEAPVDPRKLELEEQEELARIDRMREKILKTIASAKSPMRSKDSVLILCKGKAKTFYAAFAELEHEGQIVKAKEGFIVSYNTEN